MNKKSQLQFIHHCCILLEAGISLTESIDLASSLEKTKKNLKILNQIKESVQKGVLFSKSLSTNCKNFDSTLLSMVSLGESSGILPFSMRQGLFILEKRNAITRKLTSSLVYPAFIVLATVGMTLFLVMYIFPKIIPLFVSMNITLPLLTRTVKGIYEILVHQGLWMILCSVIFIFLFSIMYRRKNIVKISVQSVLLQIPIFGQLIQKYYLCTICRSVGTLLECGQTLPIILNQVSFSTSNLVYRAIMQTSEKEVTSGVTFSSTLRNQIKFIPKVVSDMISIGERTGQLGSMCLNIGKMYEEEIDEFIKQLSTMIEPVLMIGMGLVVGSVALSIILPIYEVTNHLSH